MYKTRICTCGIFVIAIFMNSREFSRVTSFVTFTGIAKAFDEELVHCKELEDLWPEATNFKSKFVAKMMRVSLQVKRTVLHS